MTTKPDPDTTPKSETKRQPIPLIRLTFSPFKGLFVGPNEAPEEVELMKPLPRIGTALQTRAATLAETHWQHHRRCLALCLLLDCDRRGSFQGGLPGAGCRGWSLMIPRQESGVEACAWSVQEQDLDLLPEGHRLAGSWQTVVGQLDDAEIDSMIPQHDGIHLMTAMRPGSDTRRVCMFARARGRLHSIQPQQIMADDITAQLDEAADRITLA